MAAIIQPPPFNAVDATQFQNTSRYFDRDNDGRLSVQEMNNAASALRYFGSTFNNVNLRNMGDAFGNLATEVNRGNRSVDANGDRMLGINGVNSELSTVSRRNNPNQLEAADLNRGPLPPTPQTQFNSIYSDYATQLFEYADSNRDGKVNINEMRSAKSALDRYGGYYSNYSNVLQRFSEEVGVGNRSVDANGDQAISYTPRSSNYRGNSELDNIIGRNNPYALETRDVYPPLITGLRIPQ